MVKMSTKVVCTLSEDKQELQKQLGCMNGIFQLFDRGYLLGQRRHGHNQKKLPQGQSDNSKKEIKNASEKPKEKSAKEKHRVSVESSRTSFSSSCSSLDCSKQVQTEPSSFCPSIVSEPSSPTSHKKQDLSADIRDVVKDSMTRKPRVVSVKTVAKDERKGPTMTHVDSPRPLQHPKLVPYDRKDQNLTKNWEVSKGVKESRFSCDGRESPYKLKSIANVKELPRLSLDSKQSSIKNRTKVIMDQTHEPGSNKRPPSSVVARLMGLEVLNDSINGGETIKIKPCLDDELVSVSRLSRKGEEFKRKVSVSPRARNKLGSSPIGDPMTRIPLELAPWKQESDSRGSQKQPIKNKNSVYGQIEKRLSEVEFKTSGKDLRALKQILEAIQRTKMRLEKEQDSESVEPVSPAIKKQEIRKAGMKPANITSDSMVITSLKRVKKVNNARNPTRMETKATGRTKRPAESQPGTVSPRLQRSKNGINKRPVRAPQSDLSRIRKQSNGKPIVSDSNTTNLKTNSSDQSESEPEVTSTDWTQENKNKFAERLIEYKPMAELAMLTMEQPSPVSVLDAFYTEDIPSPIQKKSYAFKDDDELRFDEPEWNQVGLDNLVCSTVLHQPSSGFNHVKIENIKHLVHQIELLNCSSLEANINPHESINGDHIYIKEILSASGFLKNLDCETTIFHLHPSGSLINPELFDILEKTRVSNTSSKYEKIKRKLIFDTVDNILVQKLARSASAGMWTTKRKWRILNGEKLLKELCSEIDNLQTNTASDLYDEVINIITADVNKKAEDWDDNYNEVPGLVLDIERLIFKDLISEVVNAEVFGLQDAPGRHCRQLFLM